MLAVMVTGCKEVPDIPRRFCPWFPGTEETEGMKTVIVSSQGGEFIIPTDPNNTRYLGLISMFSNVTVTGDKTTSLDIITNESTKTSRCDRENLMADHSDFDWCNPVKYPLYTHEWLGIYQDVNVLRLFVQPNYTSKQRTIYILPQNGSFVSGCLTVIQEGEKNYTY